MKLLLKFITKFYHFYNSFKFRLMIFIKGGLVSFSAKIIIDKNAKFKIGKNIRIYGSTISVSNNGELEIYDNVIINHMCTIYVENKILISNSVRISHQVSIIDHDYALEDKKINFKSKKNSKKIIIGTNVWIGANSTILKGITIGDNSIIGADTTITKNIPKNSKVVQEIKLKYLD